MLSSLVFVKKCKSLIVADNIDKTISNIEDAFYYFLKDFKGKALEDAFNYYLDSFDFDSNNIYEFINTFCPIVDFLNLENVSFNFNSDEKVILLNIFDSVSDELDLKKLNELASSLIKINAF